MGGNHRIIERSRPKNLEGEFEVRLNADGPFPFLHFRQNPRVIGRVDHDGHILMVLGGGTEHRRTTDVNFFDRLFESHPRFGDRLLEGVEIDDHHVDRDNPQPLHVVAMGGISANSQNSPLDLRMKRLQTPIHRLGKTGEIRDLLHHDPRLPQDLGGPAGGDDLDVEFGEPPAEFDDPCFIGDTDNRAFNFWHYSLSVCPYVFMSVSLKDTRTSRHRDNFHGFTLIKPRSDFKSSSVI